MVNILLALILGSCIPSTSALPDTSSPITDSTGTISHFTTTTPTAYVTPTGTLTPGTQVVPSTPGPDVQVYADPEGWFSVKLPGDWQEGEGRMLGTDIYTPRPQFGRGWFEEIMSRLGKNVLVRSHQPSAPSTMYDQRCLTIFTSSAYMRLASERIIALVDLNKEVKSAEDIRLEIV